MRSFLASAPELNVECVHLYNPTLTRAEFIEFLARAFGLSAHAAESKTALLYELEKVLLERRQAGIVPALIVDEAQSLPLELLEEIRLLANIETSEEKLLPVVLVGQPQLATRLNAPDLKQLKQRVALRCDLQPLSLNETAAYIAERVRIAGGDSARLFSPDALQVIHQCSTGIPRTISVICDNALVSGFATGQRPVGWEIVRAVCQDFDLGPAVKKQPAPAMAAPAQVPAAVASTPRRARESAAFATSPGDIFALFTRPRRKFSFF